MMHSSCTAAGECGHPGMREFYSTVRVINAELKTRAAEGKEAVLEPRVRVSSKWRRRLFPLGVQRSSRGHSTVPPIDPKTCSLYQVPRNLVGHCHMCSFLRSAKHCMLGDVFLPVERERPDTPTSTLETIIFERSLPCGAVLLCLMGSRTLAWSRAGEGPSTRLFSNNHL